MMQSAGLGFGTDGMGDYVPARAAHSTSAPVTSRRQDGARDGGVWNGDVRDGDVRDGDVRDGDVRDDGVRDGGVRDGGSDPRGSWLHAHEGLVKLARKRAGLDFEEGRLLLCAWRGETHARLGYGSFAEYVERLFGYSPRQTQEKLRVAEALEALPGTAQALRTGTSASPPSASSPAWPRPKPKANG